MEPVLRLAVQEEQEAQGEEGFNDLGSGTGTILASRETARSQEPCFQRIYIIPSHPRSNGSAGSGGVWPYLAQGMKKPLGSG